VKDSDGQRLASLVCALIFLANTTTGLGFFYSATAPAKTSLQGNCAEWIFEALETGHKSAPKLANYTTVDFTNCSAITVKDKTVLPFSPNMVRLLVFGAGRRQA
jgi:hypothetical protein